MTESSCDHDKVPDLDDTTFKIGNVMPNQLNTATKPKSSKFKFLNGVINGNIKKIQISYLQQLWMICCDIIDYIIILGVIITINCLFYS